MNERTNNDSKLRRLEYLISSKEKTYLEKKEL
jgi:hypothetical protein